MCTYALKLQITLPVQLDNNFFDVILLKWRQSSPLPVHCWQCGPIGKFSQMPFCIGITLSHSRVIITTFCSCGKQCNGSTIRSYRYVTSNSCPNPLTEIHPFLYVKP
ncbi:hypothetical protein VNO80_28446 [Phaseolus coccineus]|uniref:Uncharacterized protein n=1 Tax=Phaseolus coccineus TaxID=3886 RepID=A0AAN9L9J2_PHACN